MMGVGIWIQIQEPENSGVKHVADNCEPAGIAMAIENDAKTESANSHMKEHEKNMNTYMAHDSASGSTSFSVDLMLTPISEITND